MEKTSHNQGTPAQEYIFAEASRICAEHGAIVCSVSESVPSEMAAEGIAAGHQVYISVPKPEQMTDEEWQATVRALSEGIGCIEGVGNVFLEMARRNSN